MREFDFLEPATVQEASRLLAEHGDDARVIAGGTALMLGMRQRMLAPTHLISVARIGRLRGIDIDAQGWLRIGALSRHVDIARSALVRQHAPVLAEMAAQVANPQVRNQGTVGGNLCYADPSTDPPGCLMALDACVVLGSSRAERTLSIEKFLVDYYVTALEPDEIVLEIRVPPQAALAQGAYTRFLRTAAEHRPLVNVALVAHNDGGVCRQARLVVGASTPIPQRLRRVEALLDGSRVDARLAAQAAAMAAAEITPLSDLRGSAEFRRDMVRVVVLRTLARLFGLDINEGVAA
ncbi:carbon monoxide dehydrogenase [Comamonas phosphati]|nr:carbon monoxide dehydrogenase [Comamonas phosphati]